ncbi:hypothetical protein HK405_008318 [Cladochytrium tenue]|nr:hypothetical protein HK405_008318 [Cladochytrium tenue]
MAAVAADAASAAAPKFTLYTVGTPNGWKASIALELLGLPYHVHKIRLSQQEQKEEWFLKLSHTNDDFPVFESGAILLYLAENHDPEHILLPQDAKARSLAIQWLMWQMGGLGPMQGQAYHFVRYAPERIPYATKRYQNETLRLYGVMERGLATSDFLAGDRLSAADIACFGWVADHKWADLSLDDFPKLKAWLYRMAAIDGVKRGLDVPDKNNLIDNNFGLPDAAEVERAAKQTSKWVLEGNKSG